MDHPILDNSTKAGTAGGTLLTIIGFINSADILKTAVLAAVGALVSFCMTVLLQFLIKYFKK
jgi:hypothetical protein